MVQSRSLEEVIGQRVRELREERGQTQDEVATALRRFGFENVTRRTIAKLEAGERGPFTFRDIYALAGFFRLRPAELVSARGLIRIAEGAEVPAPALRAALGGSVPDVRGLGAERWPLARFKGLRLRQAVEAAGHTRGEAETKAAARLKVEPIDVAVAAARRYGRSLTEERDARLAGRVKDTEADRETLRAHRGHVTRELLDEMRKELAKTKSTRKGQR